MINLEVNGLKFETDSPLKAFAFATAIEFYDLSEEQATRVSELCHSIYIDVNHDLSLASLVDQVCDKIDDYEPLQYEAVIKDVLNSILDYDL